MREDDGRRQESKQYSDIKQRTVLHRLKVHRDTARAWLDLERNDEAANSEVERDEYSVD